MEQLLFLHMQVLVTPFEIHKKEEKLIEYFLIWKMKSDITSSYVFLIPW